MNFFRNKSQPTFINSIKVIEGLPDIERDDGTLIRPQEPNPNYNIWNRLLFTGRDYTTLGTGDGNLRGNRYSEDGSSENIFNIQPPSGTGTSGVKHVSTACLRDDLIFIYSNADEKNFLFKVEQETGTVLSTETLPDGTITYAEIAEDGKLWMNLSTTVATIYVYDSINNLSSPTTYQIEADSTPMRDFIGKAPSSGKFFGATDDFCRTFDSNGNTIATFSASDVQDGRGTFDTMICDDDHIYSVSAAGSALVCKFDFEGNVVEQLLLQGSGNGGCFIFAEDRLFLYYHTNTRGYIGEINQTTLAFEQTLEVGSNLTVGYEAHDCVYPGDNILIGVHGRTNAVTLVDITTFTKERANLGFGGYTASANTSNNRLIRG